MAMFSKLKAKLKKKFQKSAKTKNVVETQPSQPQPARVREDPEVRAERLRRKAEEAEIRRQEEIEHQLRKDRARKVAGLKRTADMYERAGLYNDSASTAEAPRSSDWKSSTVGRSPEPVMSPLAKTRSSDLVPKTAKTRTDNWSKYESETGMVDPMILRWD